MAEKKIVVDMKRVDAIQGALRGVFRLSPETVAKFREALADAGIKMNNPHLNLSAIKFVLTDIETGIVLYDSNPIRGPEPRVYRPGAWEIAVAEAAARAKVYDAGIVAMRQAEEVIDWNDRYTSFQQYKERLKLHEARSGGCQGDCDTGGCSCGQVQEDR